MPSLSILAWLAFLQATWALKMYNPGRGHATGVLTDVYWISEAGDPAQCDLYLRSGPMIEHVDRLLASNVITAKEVLQLKLPCDLPAFGTYEYFLVNSTDPTDVYARSGFFPIANVCSSMDPTPTSTTTSATETSSTASVTVTSSTTSATEISSTTGATETSSNISATETCSTSSDTETGTTLTPTPTTPISPRSSQPESSSTSGHNDGYGGNSTSTVPCGTPCNVITTMGVMPSGNPTPTTIQIASATQFAAQWVSVAAGFMVVMLAL